MCILTCYLLQKKICNNKKCVLIWTFLLGISNQFQYIDLFQDADSLSTSYSVLISSCFGVYIVQYWHDSFELVQIRGVDHVLGYGGFIKAVKGRRISASEDISLGASKQTEIERNHDNARHKFSQMNGTDVYFALHIFASISAN